MENEDKKKSKKNKSWILGLLLGGAAIGGGTTAVVVNQNRGPQDGEMVVNTVSEVNGHTEEHKDADFFNLGSGLLSVEQTNALSAVLKMNSDMDNRDRGRSNRGEIYFALDENGNYMDLGDVLFDLPNIDDAMTFGQINMTDDGTITMGQIGMADDGTVRRRGRSNRNGENGLYESGSTSYEELENVELLPVDIDDIPKGTKISCSVYFKYGSSSAVRNIDMEIEKLSMGFSDGIEEKKEIASKALLSDELIKIIPEEKRETATFVIKGHSDTSLYNGVPEISERSEEFNTRLSLERASSIKDLLESKLFSINPDNIQISGLGYKGCENEVSNLWKYRRADIFIIF